MWGAAARPRFHAAAGIAAMAVNIAAGDRCTDSRGPGGRRCNEREKGTNALTSLTV